MLDQPFKFNPTTSSQPRGLFDFMSGSEAGITASQSGGDSFFKTPELNFDGLKNFSQPRQLPSAKSFPSPQEVFQKQEAINSLKDRIFNSSPTTAIGGIGNIANALLARTAENRNAPLVQQAQNQANDFFANALNSSLGNPKPSDPSIWKFGVGKLF